MIEHSPRIRTHHIAILLFLTVSWGVNWPIMKLGVNAYPPLAFRTLCVGFGLPLLATALQFTRTCFVIPQKYWGQVTAFTAVGLAAMSFVFERPLRAMPPAAAWWPVAFNAVVVFGIGQAAWFFLARAAAGCCDPGCDVCAGDRFRFRRTVVGGEDLFGGRSGHGSDRRRDRFGTLAHIDSSVKKFKMQKRHLMKIVSTVEHEASL